MPEPARSPDYYDVEKALNAALGSLIQAEEMLITMGREPKNIIRWREEVETLIQAIRERRRRG
jgi:hypothetical protein